MDTTKFSIYDNPYLFAQNNARHLYERRFTTVYGAVSLYMDAVHALLSAPDYFVCPITHRWCTLCIEALDDILTEALMEKKKRDLEYYSEENRAKWMRILQSGSILYQFLTTPDPKGT